MAASMLRVSSSLAAPSFPDRLPSSSSLSLQSSFGYFTLPFSPPSHFVPLCLVRTNAVTPLASSSPVQAVLQNFGYGEDKKEEAVEEEFLKDRICASNFPWTSTTEDIRSLFEKFGTVVDIEVPMHSKGRGRGLAFVTMASPEEAASAMENLDNYEYGGRPLKMNYAKPKKQKYTSSTPKTLTTKQGQPAFCLYVSNLSYEANEEDLKQFFVEGGANILAAELIYTQNPRRSTGFGFVFFKNKREAEAAISTFQDKELMGRPIRVARGRQFFRSPRIQGSPAATATDDTTTTTTDDTGSANKTVS